MHKTEPKVYLIAKPSLNWDAIRAYLQEVGGESWADKRDSGQPGQRQVVGAGQTLIEFMGRLCYRSWEPGLNPNVTKIREDQNEYLANIIQVKHGSVLEHANYSFVFHNVSRVFTHELVRHRAGTAISQESLRFVRLTDLGFWMPDWAQEDEELVNSVDDVLGVLEEHQAWLARHFKLDDDGVPFAEKKHKTSFMRRLAPIGLSTGLGWTANIRTIRHVITMRTAVGAEEEIRRVFYKVAEVMKEQAPALFHDFVRNDDGSWECLYEKV